MLAQILEILKTLFGQATKEIEITHSQIHPNAPIKSKLYTEDDLISNIIAMFGVLKPKQIEGFKFIFRKYFEAGLTDFRHLAYMYATAWHETAFTMQPIIEYGSAEYLKSKKYYPYIGRGYVQLTWRNNYEKYGIANNVDRALDPEYAAFIMLDGMSKGIFTGKKLSDYFNDKINDPVNARRIINGTDKAHQIAEYHNKFLKAITATI